MELEHLFLRIFLELLLLGNSSELHSLLINLCLMLSVLGLEQHPLLLELLLKSHLLASGFVAELLIGHGNVTLTLVLHHQNLLLKGLGDHLSLHLDLIVDSLEVVVLLLLDLVRGEHHCLLELLLLHGSWISSIVDWCSCGGKWSSWGSHRCLHSWGSSRVLWLGQHDDRHGERSV